VTQAALVLAVSQARQAVGRTEGKIGDVQVRRWVLSLIHSQAALSFRQFVVDVFEIASLP
jgi:hypothetical protein